MQVTACFPITPQMNSGDELNFKTFAMLAPSWFGEESFLEKVVPTHWVGSEWATEPCHVALCIRASWSVVAAGPQRSLFDPAAMRQWILLLCIHSVLGTCPNSGAWSSYAWGGSCQLTTTTIVPVGNHDLKGTLIIAAGGFLLLSASQGCIHVFSMFRKPNHSVKLLNRRFHRASD